MACWFVMKFARPTRKSLLLCVEGPREDTNSPKVTPAETKKGCAERNPLNLLVGRE
jgi:hypothetical protein